MVWENHVRTSGMKTTDQTADFGLQQLLSPSAANPEEGRGPFDTKWTANTLPQLGINTASSADEFVPQAQGFHFLQIKKEKIILFNLPVPKRFF